MPVTIEVKGFDELKQALESATEVALPLLLEAMAQALVHIQDIVVEYPPATTANRPGRMGANGRPMGFYERGQGWWYPVMRRATLGERPRKSAGAMTTGRARGLYKLGRRAALGVAGYKLIRSSEDLKESWTIDVRVSDEAVEGVLGTNTSYVEAVQGNNQARFHAERGWKTIDRAVEEAMPAIEDEFERAADELINRLTGGQV